MKTTKTLLFTSIAALIPSLVLAMPAGDPVTDTHGQPFRPNNKMEKLLFESGGFRGRVIEKLRDPVYGAHTKQLNFDINRHLGIGVQGKFQLKDPTLLDPQQKAFRQRGQRNNKDFQFVGTGAAVNLNGKLGFTFGKVSINFGAQAGLRIYREQSVDVTGARDALAEAKRVLHQNTVKLPTSLERMEKQMKQGDLVVWEGWAEVGGSVHAGYNTNIGETALGNLARGLGSVEATLGIGASASRKRLVRLTFRKLEDVNGVSKMMSTIEEIPTQTRSISAKAELALRTNFKGEWADNKLSELAYGQLDRGIERVASAGFAAEMTRSESKNIVVDRKIFDLKTRKVLEEKTLNAYRLDRIHGIKAEVFNYNLFRAARKMQVTDEWLNVSVDGHNTFVRVTQGAHDTNTEGALFRVFGDGDKHFNRRMYVVQGTENDVPAYHVNLEFGAENDRFQLTNEVPDGFFGAAKAMGGILEKAEINGRKVSLKKVHKALRKSQNLSFEGSLHLNALGVKRVVTSNEQQFMEAFKKTYGAFIGETRIKYTRLFGLLRGGFSDKAIPFAFLHPNREIREKAIRLLESEGQNAHQEYLNHTQCDYAKERRAWRAYKGVWNMMTKVKREGGDAKAKVKKFISESREAGEDIFDLLVVLAGVAKPDGITLEKMKMEGKKGGKVEFKSEGAFNDPRIQVTKAFEVPAPVQ